MTVLQTPLLGGTAGTFAEHSMRYKTKRNQELAACSSPRGTQLDIQPTPEKTSRAGEVGLCLLAGMLLWLMTLALAVGFATFAFMQMPSEGHLAISMQVLGTAVCFMWLGIRSKNPASCVQASPIPAIYISIFIKSCESYGLMEEARVSTVLLFVWITTFVQGLAFVLCSQYHMGDVLQYFPVSVTTGYNGGIGLLILNASVSMMAGVNPLENMHGFLQQGPLLLALPGTLLAPVVYFISLRCTGPAFKVLPILTTILLFYLFLFVSGTSLAEARDLGWIFPDYGFSKPTEILSSFNYKVVSWHMIGSGATLVPPMTLISMVAQYASLGAILLQVAESTKDADAETKHLGQASLLSALVGSMPNLSGMAPSALLMGVAGKRGASSSSLVICGFLHLMLFLSGFPLVSYLPKCSIAGCLLMPISIKMIRGALLESLAVSTWGDYVVIWVMSWTTLFLNIQWGLASGFILSVFRLLYEYAHFDVVDRRESLSKVVTLKGRDARSKHVLEEHGEEVAAYRLKGVLFFGNCVSLKLELSGLLDGKGTGVKAVERIDSTPPKFLVVDFSEVVYVDTSVWEILANITQRARRLSHSEVYLCGLHRVLFAELMRQGEKLLARLNLDYIQYSYLLTLEQIEDKILATAEVSTPELGGWDLFTAWVSSGFLNGQADKDLHDRLQKYFTEVRFAEGEMVQFEGAAASAFYWVMSGEFHMFMQEAPAVVPNKDQPWSPAITKYVSSANLAKRVASMQAEQKETKALLFGKLTPGFIAGGEAFCFEVVNCKPNPLLDSNGPVSRPMQSFMSIQCKHAGSVLALKRDDFTRLREEDPELAVAILLAVTSRREVQLRSHMLYRVEPEEVETVNGFRRRFTMPTSAETIHKASANFRYDPFKAMGVVAHSGFETLKHSVIRMQDRRSDHAAPGAGCPMAAPSLASHPH